MFSKRNESTEEFVIMTDDYDVDNSRGYANSHSPKHILRSSKSSDNGEPVCYSTKRVNFTVQCLTWRKKKNNLTKKYAKHKN